MLNIDQLSTAAGPGKAIVVNLNKPHEITDDPIIWKAQRLLAHGMPVRPEERIVLSTIEKKARAAQAIAEYERQYVDDVSDAVDDLERVQPWVKQIAS